MAKPMTLDELSAHLRENPAFVATEEELRPFLTIADDILKLRLQRKLTIGQLAGMANVSRQTLYVLESGDGNPTIGMLQKVAKALDAKLMVSLVPRETKDPKDALALIDKWMQDDPSIDEAFMVAKKEWEDDESGVAEAMIEKQEKWTSAKEEAEWWSMG